MSVPSNLAELSPGKAALVCGLDSDSHLAARLGSMGILPGTEVKVLKHAPFGDPVWIEFEGQQLSLRRAEAARIQIQLL